MSSLPARSWVYLPVQTKVREIVAKVLLSCAVAEAGMGSLLLTHRRFRPIARQLPPGVVGDYTVTRPVLPLFYAYQQSGHRVAAWEEEGLAAIPTDAVKACARFLSWGQAEADRATANDPSDADKIHVTGNPRADLLREEFRGLFTPEAERLQAAHGSFVLVNGNFSANVVYGEEELKAQWRLEYDEFTPELKAYYNERWAHSRALHEAFLKMVPALGRAFPDTTIVMRPHPSEDTQAWEIAVAEQPNVKVIFDGPVLGWLAAATAVVHNSCTTGIESAVMGRPTFAYRPVVNEAQDWALANDVSTAAPDLDSLVGWIRSTLAGSPPPPPAEALETLGHHVAALTGPLASDRMATVFSQLAGKPSHLPSALGPRAVVGEGWYDAKHRVRTVLGRTSTPLSFEKQKNPGWAAGEIRQIVDDLRAVTGRFRDVEVLHLANGVTAFWS